jgi:hypothetical protein
VSRTLAGVFFAEKGTCALKAIASPHLKGKQMGANLHPCNFLWGILGTILNSTRFAEPFLGG